MNYLDIFTGCAVHKCFNYYCHACLVNTVGTLSEILNEKEKENEHEVD